MKNQINRSVVAEIISSSARAAVNVWLIVLIAFLATVAGSWFYWSQRRQPSVTEVVPVASAVVLSEATAKILAGLDTTVEVRFFVPRDPSVLPSVVAGYCSRIEDLLVEYERVGAGKLLVIHSDPEMGAAAKAAAGAAGVGPVAMESGEIYYLGLTVGSGSRKETIAPLTPEWEAALESDLSRTILRVTAKNSGVVRANSSSATPAQPAPINPAISEELLRAFPDLATRSFDDVALNLRQHTLEEFKIAAAELQTKMAEAQKKLADAQANKSEAAQQAVAKELQQLQTEQANKLGGITAQLQERITVLQQLKAASNLPAHAP